MTANPGGTNGGSYHRSATTGFTSPFRRLPAPPSGSSSYYVQQINNSRLASTSSASRWREPTPMPHRGDSSSPPNSPLRHFTLATTTLPRRSPNTATGGQHPPSTTLMGNGGVPGTSGFLQTGSSTLGRSKSKSSAWLGQGGVGGAGTPRGAPFGGSGGGLKKLRSADRLMNWSQRSDSPPLDRKSVV